MDKIESFCLQFLGLEETKKKMGLGEHSRKYKEIQLAGCCAAGEAAALAGAVSLTAGQGGALVAR